VFRCLFPLLTSYAVTGAEDHKLRLWPLDFTDFLLEAQHEGVVTNIRISLDGRKLAIGTNAGTLGVLNVSEHSYNTVLRCVFLCSVSFT
jgi:WD40 repeat protein